MKSASLFFLLVFLCAIIGSAQESNCNQKITGKILDIDGKPLPHATVSILNTSHGTVTNSKGDFTITNICTNEIDLEVRFLGYKTIIHHHDFHHPDPIIYMASDETVLESVVVEKSLNAHELKTLKSKSIHVGELESLGVTAGELFSMNSGVSSLKTGQNIIKPIVHGLHSNRVLIINNGVRHSYQAWGLEHGVEIDASQIDQIQLVKGASTVRYGSDALGGVILFSAKPPTYETKFKGEANGGFQTNGQSVGGELVLQQGHKRMGWIATMSRIKQGDLKAPDYQLTNTGKEELGVTLGAKFHFPAIDIDLYISHFDQQLGILRGSVNGNLIDLSQAMRAKIPNETKPFSYNINNPKQETTHDLIRLKSALFLGKQQFDLQYAYQRNIRQEYDIRRGTNNERPAIDLQLSSHAFDIDWDHPSNGIWAGTYGLQILLQDNNNIAGTNTIPFVPNYNNNTIGIYGIESFTRQNTTLEAGIRFDLMNLNVRGRDSRNRIYRDDLNYKNFSFTLGAIKQLNSTTTIRTNIGTAWRAPNVNELYSFGKHQSIFEYGLWRYQIYPENDSISTLGVQSNAQKEVKSERGIKWITTLNFKKNNFEAEMTPYANWIQNYFFIRPHGLTKNVRGTFPYFIHEQTDAFYSGVDLDVRHSWGQLFDGELKFSYVYAIDTRKNQAFTGIPPWNIQYTIERKLGDFTIQIKPEWEAKQDHEPPVIAPEAFSVANKPSIDRSGTFDFLPAPNAFFLLNASIGYEKKSLSIKLKGDNILNTSYRKYTDLLRYFADDRGLNLSIFISYKF